MVENMRTKLRVKSRPDLVGKEEIFMSFTFIVLVFSLV